IGQMAGASNTDWRWRPLITDLDYDGSEYLVVSNGRREEARNNDCVKNSIFKAEQLPHNAELSQSAILSKQLDNLPSKTIANYVFKNNGDLNFEDKTEKWGLIEPSFSTGSIYADLDNDGDLDLVFNNIDDTAFVYSNTNNQSLKNNFL